MAEIPGIVFIIVGAGIGMISLLVGYSDLIVFFWAGIAMVVFGAVKLSLRKKSTIGFAGTHPDTGGSSGRQQQEEARAQQASQQHGQQQHQRHQGYPPCPYCGRPTHPNFVFCPFCGSRIR